MAPRAQKNPHAVALGRLGGAKSTPKQKAAARRNGKRSNGRPRNYPAGITALDRMHLYNIRLNGGEPRTAAQRAVVEKLARLKARSK